MSVLTSGQEELAAGREKNRRESKMNKESETKKAKTR